jgi:SecD/SecF fusion protein
MEGHNNKLRWIILLVLISLAVWKVIPTVRMATMDEASLAAMDPQDQVELRAQTVKRGLDLQGGMRIVLEVDLVELIRNLARTPDNRFKERMDRVESRLTALNDFWELFADEFADTQLSEYFGERRQTNEEIIDNLKTQSVDAIDNSLVILRNRVDGSGLQEPSISKQGQRRIVVELAGVNDPEAARRMIGKTALLEFKLVEQVERTNQILEAINEALKGEAREEPAAETQVAETDNGTPEAGELLADGDAAPAEDTDTTLVTDGEFDPLAAGDLEEMLDDVDTGNPFFDLLTIFQGRNSVYVSEANRDKLLDLLARDEVKAAVPPTMQLLLGKMETLGEETFAELFLVQREAELTGKVLKTAGVNIAQGGDGGQAGASIVELEMDREGARRFARVTGDNVNRRLAIVLDDRVFMAPNIRSKIPNGRAIIEGLESIEEAKELANLLKHGALPSTVKTVEERTVGPSLGQESVKQGAFSAILGFVLVIFFMMVYYKKAGIFSVAALLLNMLFIFALLAGFGATLTLPGIAGIVLTIGMAVDANVLIFERIREEAGRGKSVRNAVDAGYAQAFSTIVDANVTTLIASVVLYQFGSGPIRGFALTLMMGIATSMYTAIVVTRLLFDAFTDYDRATRLSI